MSTFALDPVHSSVDFSVRHLMISKVRGSFGRVAAQLEVDEATGLPTAVSAQIDVASIDTKVADRDAHLRSADFFDAEAFPTITFRSNAVKSVSGNLAIDGDLTIHGVTRPVTLETEFDGRATDPWGNDRVAYSAKAKISRKDFGMTWNQALEAGGIAVGDEIDITLTIQAVKAKIAVPA